MYITHIKKTRKIESDSQGGLYEGYWYYRLSEAYRNADGKPRSRVVMTLGELTGVSKGEIIQVSPLKNI